MTERLNIVNIKELVSQLSSEYRIPSAATGIFHDGTITDFAVGLMNLSTRALTVRLSLADTGGHAIRASDVGAPGAEEPRRRRRSWRRTLSQPDRSSYALTARRCVCSVLERVVRLRDPNARAVLARGR
jgi:hypothetical protein